MNKINKFDPALDFLRPRKVLKMFLKPHKIHQLWGLIIFFRIALDQKTESKKKDQNLSTSSGINTNSWPGCME